MKLLIIDVTKPDAFFLWLMEAGAARAVICKKRYRGARHNLLQRMDGFLAASSLAWKEISGIALIEGGGSFSAVRQAAAILNTVAFVRRLPVAGFDFRKYASFDDIWRAAARHFNRSRAIKYLTPIYSGEPNIRL